MRDDDGRVFLFDREESYVKPTGEAGRFAVWKTACRKCGRAIEVSTSPRCAGAVLHKVPANCEEHKGARKKKPAAVDDAAGPQNERKTQ